MSDKITDDSASETTEVNQKIPSLPYEAPRLVLLTAFDIAGGHTNAPENTFGALS